MFLNELIQNLKRIVFSSSFYLKKLSAKYFLPFICVYHRTLKINKFFETQYGYVLL